MFKLFLFVSQCVTKVTLSCCLCEAILVHSSQLILCVGVYVVYICIYLIEMSSEGLDELLSEAVREYPALYDKSRKGHHDKALLKNCWVKVAEVCGLEDDKEATRLFGNLKKRYNKARSKAKLPSGSGLKDSKKLVIRLPFVVNPVYRFTMHKNEHIKTGSNQKLSKQRFNVFIIK